ncbi:MAG: hypothetical protein DME86_03405 [Verrucomicrobia bacterium]|nr:MAG: hypothetical protein DME86_03405 [Verrucomicrobiota bacterium]
MRSTPQSQLPMASYSQAKMLWGRLHFPQQGLEARIAAYCIQGRIVLQPFALSKPVPYRFV